MYTTGPISRILLIADSQLYKRLCPSVRPSVGWSVGPLVSTSRKVWKCAYPPLPTRPQLVWPCIQPCYSLGRFRFSFCLTQLVLYTDNFQKRHESGKECHGLNDRSSSPLRSKYCMVTWHGAWLTSGTFLTWQLCHKSHQRNTHGVRETWEIWVAKGHGKHL